MIPGTLLAGRYRLDDLLSEHGDARFWRATDTVLARNVAVHVLPSDDPRAAEVLAAARRSAGFSDPRFLRVLDCDDADGITWVIHEWGEGRSLDVVVGQGPLPAMRAAWLAREVAGAIAAAHAAGLQHGRLNPEAVMISDSGSVRIIGFQVNAAFDPAPVHPAYGPIGPRETDVVDLAGILYAALTGRWPGITPSALPPAPREGQRPLRPRQVRAGVPRTLDAICDRVLHKEAAQHVHEIETAYEISAALSDYVGDPALIPADGPLPPWEELGDPEPTIEPDPGPQPEPEPDPEPQSEPRSEPDPEPEPAADPAPTMAAVLDGLHDLIEPEPWVPLPPAPPAEATDRPLFADHERRVPPGAPQPPAPGRAAEPPTGPAPVPAAAPRPSWPFEDEVFETRSVPAPKRRRWPLLAGALILLLALIAGSYTAYRLGRQGSTGTPAPSPTPSATSVPTGPPIKIVGIGDFDPEGDPPRENPDQVRFAIDGNPATGWQTSTYRRDAHLGGLKSGVGLVLDLGSTTEVGSVTVQLIGTPTDLELYGTPAGVDSPPAELADTRRLARLSGAGTSAVFRLEPTAHTRFLVLWLTSLPAVKGGFRGEVAEVTVRR